MTTPDSPDRSVPECPPPRLFCPLCGRAARILDTDQNGIEYGLPEMALDYLEAELAKDLPLPSKLPIRAEVYAQPGSPPFIFGIQGHVTGEAFEAIERALAEDEFFANAEGVYLCRPEYERGDEHNAPGWYIDGADRIADLAGEPALEPTAAAPAEGGGGEVAG